MKELQPPNGSRHGGKLQEHLQRKLDERKMRQRKSASTSSRHGVLKFKQSNNRALPVIPGVFTNKIGNGSNNKQISNITSNMLGTV